MNRMLMLLIPVVILVAMGLILLQQMWSGPGEDMQAESVAGGSLPFADNTVPTPLSSADLDEAIRREQINRTQSAPELPRLDGMPQEVTAQITPPVAPGIAAPRAATPPVASQTAASSGDGTKSELGRLADASVAGQPGTGGSPAADELARQVAAGSQGGQPQTTSPAQVAQTATAEKSEPLENFAMTATSLKAAGSEMILTLTADKRFSYKSFVLTGPDRLVIDLAGAWQGIKVPGMPSNRLISKVREGKFEDSHRIVLDLKAPLAGYETKRVDDQTVTVRMY